MKVLVTGGAGFIGSHVVDACCQRGWDVIALDSLDPGVYKQPPTYLNPEAEYCFADLRQWTPDERFDDVEAVVHLAALGGVQRAGHDRENVVSANVQGTVRLCSAAQKWNKLKRIVLGSSFSVYGSNYSYRAPSSDALLSADRREEDLEAGRYEVYCPKSGEAAEIVPINELAPPNPLEAYAASKYMQELAFRGSGLPLKTLRFSSVYGSRLRLDDGEATIIAKLTGWIQSGITPKLFEDGQQIRDWVHVDDVVAAILSHLTNSDTPDLVNVCSGGATTLQEACELIATASNVSCSPEIVGGYRPGDMRHCLGDTTKLRQLIGRDPILFNQGVEILCREG